MSNFILIINLALLLLLVMLLMHFPWPFRQPLAKRKRSWQLRPRSPKDCELCCQTSPDQTEPPLDIIPWSLRKSPRGRPKSIPTHGFFCDNPDCDYFHVTDDTVHALVGDGIRGVLFGDIVTPHCSSHIVTHPMKL